MLHCEPRHCEDEDRVCIAGTRLSFPTKTQTRTRAKGKKNGPLQSQIKERGRQKPEKNPKSLDSSTQIEPHCKAPLNLNCNLTTI